MLSKLAKIDFYPLMEMFSNPAIHRDLSTFRILNFPFSKTTNLAQKTLFAHLSIK